jgi:2'-5' RNA ligase
VVADLSKQRLFLAVAIPDEVRHAVAAHLDFALDGAALPGRPVPPQNWHITLRFLGYVYDDQRELLLAKVDQAELGEPFTVGFAGLGAFPRPKRATVLWLGIAQGAEALTQVAAVVEEAVVEAGWFQEERPFHPHLTLSRIRPQEDVTELVDSMPAFPLSINVDEVVLYRSHLGGGPARYQITERFPLG